MVYIEDDIHAELEGPFATFENAVAELHRRAAIAWDSPPNQAPCASWRTCGRQYFIREYDNSETGRVLRETHVFDISSNGVNWIEGFEKEWQKVNR